jgi:hypothetical protein
LRRLPALKPGACTHGGANYAINCVDNATGVITPAALSIVADSAERRVETPNPPFTATYVGLVGGDTPASLSGNLDFRTTATIDSPVGSYPITPFGQASMNYNILYVDGVLAVTAQPAVPAPVAGAGFNAQAVAAAYSRLGSPLQRLPALQYITGKDEAHGDDSAATIRIVTGGLNVHR